MKTKLQTSRQALYLSRFNFTLICIPGVEIGKADGLSKKLDWKVRVEKSEVDIIENNNKVVIVTKEMKKNRMRILRNKEWQIKEKMILKERKIYILKNKKLSTEIIQLYSYDKKLSVAGSNKRYRKIHEWIQLVLENKEQNRDTSRKFNGK